MNGSRICFKITLLLFLLSVSNTIYAGEFIKGLTIDCYPRNDFDREGNNNLNELIFTVNRLHESGEYHEVLMLLEEAMDTVANTDDKYRLKYLYLFKLNQYGRWIEEVSELISVAEDIDKISNDTVRLYLKYYLVKFDLKQLEYPLSIFIQDIDRHSLEQSLTKLINEANDIRLYELKIQLRRLMNSKDIQTPDLNAILQLECKTELDSFRIGRLGYVPFIKAKKADTVDHINTGLKLMDYCPAYDHLQKFQYAVNIMKFALLTGNDSVYKFCQEQCLKSMELLNDLEVDYHYYLTLSDLSDYLPQQEAFENLRNLNKTINSLQIIKSSWQYKEKTISKILHTYSRINFQKRILIILSVALFVIICIVIILYILLLQKNRKIRSQSKLLGGLIGSMSHDVRMPLRQCIEEIESKRGQSSGVLLELKKIESFINEINISIKTRQYKTKYKLQDLIEETLALYSGALIRNSIQVRNNLDLDSEKQIIPSQHFNIAIRNLLLNAIEHNPPNGFINISAEQDESNFTLTIENSTWEELDQNEIKGLGLELIKRLMKDQKEFIDLEQEIKLDRVSFKIIWTTY